MRLRSSLFFLVAATAIPLIIFAAITSALLILHDQDNFVRAVKDRNRAFMSAVDAELKGDIEALKLLTAISNVETNDFAQIHRELTYAAATHPNWVSIVLLSPEGQQLANTAVPYGTVLPPANDADSLRRAVATQQPVIGAITLGRFLDEYGIPIRVPVVRNGKVAYVLTAVVKQEAFQTLLKRQDIPAEWAAGITGPDGRLIARVPFRPPGSFPAAEFLQAIANVPEGWNRMTTLEGIANYTAHATSPFTGWTVSIAIPAPIIVGGIYRAVWIAFIGVFVTITVAAVLAVLLGRRIAGPIAQLASSAPLLGTLTGPQRPKTNIDEVIELAAALERASIAIRDRENLERARRNAIELADRKKDEFIAMLSHELRNPLAALSNSSTILKLAKPGSAAAMNAQEIVERQTRQMARLIDDLLEVSRIIAGKSPVNVEPVELSNLVSHVVQTWRNAGRLSRHDVSLTLEVVWVKADRVRVEQILSNLLDNAVKFTPPEKSLEIAVQRREAYGRIVVRDQGAGIAAADIERIFDLFAQGSQGIARTRGGLGIGLALVKRLVEMQGGKVSVESSGRDQGAAFNVDFPSCAPSHEIEPVAPDDSSVARLLRVLVVEDKEDARESLVSLLSLLGYIVRQAPNGEEALRQFADCPPDIALIDIGLPDIDGYELARRVRSPSLRSPVTLVALTGYGQPQDIQRSMDAGFDFHLTKPVGADDFKALFDRIKPSLVSGNADPSATRPAA